VGIKESWPAIEALIRYMPMAKSVESRAPRFCVSARLLPAYSEAAIGKQIKFAPYLTELLHRKLGFHEYVTSLLTCSNPINVMLNPNAITRTRQKAIPWFAALEQAHVFGLILWGHDR